jgi:hypothetical protein
VFLSQFASSLLRRWYFLIPGLALAALLGTVAYQRVPVTFQATSSQLLLPPTAVVGEGGNPYLYLGGLNQALDVLALNLNAEDVQADFRSSHNGDSFTAGADTSTTGPILLLTSRSTSRDGAVQILGDAGKEAVAALDALQTELSVPEGSRLHVIGLTSDTAAQIDDKSRLQVVGGTVAAGMVGAVLATGLLDRMLTIRRTRKTRSSGAPNSTSPKVAPPDAPAESGHAIPARETASNAPSWNS